MTEQSVIQVLLLVVLVWYLAVWWCLVVRDWAGWEHLRWWKKPKRRKRRPRAYKRPKPFEGLTRKPVCAACAAEEEREGEGVPREAPPKIERERGRRPEIDTSGQFCPAEECVYYGWLDRGNIVSNGHPGGGPWRQLHCVECGKYFQETLGTIFYGSSVPAEDIIRVILALSEGVSPRKVGRIFGVDKDTVLRWLVAASAHSEGVLGYVMDELYALLRDVNEEGKGRRRCWVWAAIDPMSKLLLAVEVGDRGLEMAQRLVHGVVSVLAPGVVPLFLTDQFAAYGRALLTHPSTSSGQVFGHWVEKVSEKSGRVLRRWVPDDQLCYAQVKKRRARRKIVEVTRLVVYGARDAVEVALTEAGHKINTAFIERVNRTWRAHVPGLGRREEGLAKSESGLRRRVVLVMGYYDLCLPHASLREALVKPEPTKGSGSLKKWRPRTPAMAAGLTDHVWPMKEFLLFRVPPWRQEAVAA
jgi:IS1 family transposase